MSLSKNRSLFLESSAICVGYKRERALAAIMHALVKVRARFEEQGIDEVGEKDRAHALIHWLQSFRKKTAYT